MNLDKQRLEIEFLLQTTEKKCFFFDKEQTILKIKETVYTDWPKEWSVEKPKSKYGIKLLLRGRFMENNLPLKYYIQTAEKTTIHLLTDIKKEKRKNENKKKSFCCLF